MKKNEIEKIHFKENSPGDEANNPCDIRIVSFNRNGEIIFANSAFCIFYNKTLIEVTGSNIFEFIHKQDHNRVKKILNLPDWEGNSMRVNISVNSINVESGRQRWIFTLIPPGKRAEPKIFAVINDAREHENNVIKHKLRTPLNVIIGYSQFLLDKESISNSQRKHIETILNNGYSLLKGIDEIFPGNNTDTCRTSEEKDPDEHGQGAENITGYSGNRRRILIVDDWEATRIFFIDLLSSVGFEIDEAANGSECLAKINEFKPHAVLMDLFLPDMDGFEILDKIKAGNGLKDVKVIITTAGDSKIDRNKSLEKGCVDFILKPVKIEKLFGILQRHLNLKWLYGTPGPTQTFDGCRDIIPPPGDMLDLLYESAMIYDYQNLLAKLKEIEKRGAEFEPFAERIKALAEKFNMIEIMKFIKSFGGL